MNSAELHAAIDSLATAHGRQLWETMQDVFAAAPGHLAVIESELPALLDVGNRGSVIARDHLVKTLAQSTPHGADFHPTREASPES